MEHILFVIINEMNSLTHLIRHSLPLWRLLPSLELESALYIIALTGVDIYETTRPSYRVSVSIKKGTWWYLYVEHGRPPNLLPVARIDVSRMGYSVISAFCLSTFVYSKGLPGILDEFLSAHHTSSASTSAQSLQ